jgi:hypothetical protein
LAAINCLDNSCLKRAQQRPSIRGQLNNGKLPAGKILLVAEILVGSNQDVEHAFKCR